MPIWCLSGIDRIIIIIDWRNKKTQKGFIWNNLTPKIQHKTLCNSFEEGGLKNANKNSKIPSLQCSWIKRLYVDKLRE